MQRNNEWQAIWQALQDHYPSAQVALIDDKANILIKQLIQLVQEVGSLLEAVPKNQVGMIDAVVAKHINELPAALRKQQKKIESTESLAGQLDLGFAISKSDRLMSYINGMLFRAELISPTEGYHPVWQAPEAPTRPSIPTARVISPENKQDEIRIEKEPVEPTKKSVSPLSQALKEASVNQTPIDKKKRLNERILHQCEWRKAESATSKISSRALIEPRKGLIWNEVLAKYIRDLKDKWTAQVGKTDNVDLLFFVMFEKDPCWQFHTLANAVVRILDREDSLNPKLQELKNMVDKHYASVNAIDAGREYFILLYNALQYAMPRKTSASPRASARPWSVLDDISDVLVKFKATYDQYNKKPQLAAEKRENK